MNDFCIVVETFVTMKMSKNTPKLFDDILRETKTYRCEYLEILIEKYVKTQEEVVDIQMHNFTLAKHSNYLKRIEEKSFGYVSSYECKSAKKTISYWKKKIILRKRTSFRKHAGAESFYDDCYSTNFKRNVKYLSPAKVYETLLTFQKDNSYCLKEETENTFLNETNLDDDQHSFSFDKENKSILSCEDCSLFLSDIARTQQNEAFRTNKAIKTLATVDKKYLSVNIQKLTSVNLLKSSNCKQLDILIENSSSTNDNRWNNKALKNGREKLTVCSKNIASSEMKEKSSINGSAFNAYNSKSFTDYVLSKCTPKFRFSKIGMGISDENSQISNTHNVKSLFCVSNKSMKPHILKISENINFQASSECDTKSLPYVSNKSTEIHKLKIHEIGMGTSSKICEDSRNCNFKFLPYVSNTSFESCNLSDSAIGIEGSNKKWEISNDCAAKPLSCAPDKSPEPLKLRVGEISMKTSYKNCPVSNSNNVKSLVYTSNSSKFTETAKFRFSSLEVKRTNTLQAFNVCNAKSLIYASDKSLKLHKHRFSESGRRTCNQNLTSHRANVENFVDIDPLSLKKDSNEKKLHKKKSSLVQSTLPFCKSKLYKKHADYLETNNKIDDLSLKQFSNPTKILQNK